MKRNNHGKTDDNSNYHPCHDAASGDSKQIVPDQVLGSSKQSVAVGVPEEPISNEAVCQEPVGGDPVPDKLVPPAPVSNEPAPAETTYNEPLSDGPFSEAADVTDQALAKLPLPGFRNHVAGAQNAPMRGPTINYVVNYVNHASPQLNIASGREWKVSYQKCKRIGEHLDFREKWKMLASKLKFDRAIDGVEQWSSNNHASPTETLLREWMLVQKKESRDTCYQGLIKALEDMGRKDIVYDLEDTERGG